MECGGRRVDRRVKGMDCRYAIKADRQQGTDGRRANEHMRYGRLVRHELAQWFSGKEMRPQGIAKNCCLTLYPNSMFGQLNP